MSTHRARPAEAASGGAGDSPLRRASLARWVFALAAVAVLAIGCTRLFAWAMTRQVSFDGAMNLEIARSLAEGGGYRRLYSDHSAFTHAIQTRAPFIVPAAAVFAAFGVGIWQAQLVNLAYALALGALVFVLFRRQATWPWALAAAGAGLATPGILNFGLNGYGEVPSLVWWLAGLLVLYAPGEKDAASYRRVAGAGVLFGIAIVTKTVLAIGLTAAVPVWLVHQSSRTSRTRTMLALAAMAAGVALPVLGHEIWHAIAVHDVSRWIGWVREEWREIRMQAGTHNGFSDTASLPAKIAAHFGILAEAIGLPRPALALWFASVALLLISLRRRFSRASFEPLLATLVVFVALYFVWWLAVTPTQKAWHRRILNGIVALELLTLFAAYLATRDWKAWTRRVRAAVACASAFALASVALACGRELADDDWPESTKKAEVEADLAAIRALGANVPLYGVGWYSAPAVALYGGRKLGDIVATPPESLAAASPVALVLDPPAQAAGVGDYWLQRYPHTELRGSRNLRIYSLETDRRVDSFAGEKIDPSLARGYVDFRAGNYPYAVGFYDREGKGWRWARADVEALLKYSGERAFRVDKYVPPLTRYAHGAAIRITVWIGDCKLGTLRQDREGRVAESLPMAACPTSAGEIVRVRLVSDNMIAKTEDRQMSFVANGFGFSDEAVPSDP